MFFVILQYISSVPWWHQNASLMSEKSVILKEVKCAAKANVELSCTPSSSFSIFFVEFCASYCYRTGFDLFLWMWEARALTWKCPSDTRWAQSSDPASSPEPMMTFCV